MKSISPMGSYRAAGKIWTVEPIEAEVSEAEYAELASKPNRLLVEVMAAPMPIAKPQLEIAPAPVQVEPIPELDPVPEDPKPKRFRR